MIKNIWTKEQSSSLESRGKNPLRSKQASQRPNKTQKNSNHHRMTSPKDQTQKKKEKDLKNKLRRCLLKN